MNPDTLHIREYNDYLARLTMQDLLNLTPQENAWRLERIKSVENCIHNLQEKQKNQL